MHSTIHFLLNKNITKLVQVFENDITKVNSVMISNVNAA